MNRKQGFLALALLLLMLTTLWTSRVVAAPVAVDFSVRTSLGNFGLSIPVDTPQGELEELVYEQVWEQLGPALTGQYGLHPAEAITTAVARQLVLQVMAVIERYSGYSAQPAAVPEQHEEEPEMGLAGGDTREGNEPVDQLSQPQPEPAAEPDPTPEAAVSQPGPAGLTPAEARMLELINRERVQRGLRPLEPDLAVTREARKKSQDMISNGYFGHISPTYGSPFAQLARAGISFRSAGENLAGAPTVERAHMALMNSPGHRANILNPNFTHVGIGIVDGGPYGKMLTQMFIQK